MAIQVRRGVKDDFDPTKMLPGEWAVSIDTDTNNQIVWMCFKAGVVKRMGTYEFLSVFEYILTDRGSEFGDPVALETGLDEIQRTSIYYCDPMRSGQKGGLEQAHTMLRMVLPKGTSFEFLTQWDVNLIVNHINSTPRESLKGSTPYDAALETLGKETLNAFQLKRCLLYTSDAADE